MPRKHCWALSILHGTPAPCLQDRDTPLSITGAHHCGWRNWRHAGGTCLVPTRQYVGMMLLMLFVLGFNKEVCRNDVAVAVCDDTSMKRTNTYTQKVSRVMMMTMMRMMTMMVMMMVMMMMMKMMMMMMERILLRRTVDGFDGLAWAHICCDGAVSSW